MGYAWQILSESGTVERERIAIRKPPKPLYIDSVECAFCGGSGEGRLYCMECRGVGVVSVKE
jgi:hypothetical protein